MRNLKCLSTVLSALFFASCAGPVPPHMRDVDPLWNREEPAGSVTTLNGTAKVARSNISMTIQFRDNIFSRDRITTEQESLVRILLNGKAQLIIHELSVLAIASGPGETLIELDKGKIGYVLPKDRLQPGEAHKIRTPNAIVEVRGTVVVVRTEQPADQIKGSSPSSVTQVDVLAGSVLVGSVTTPFLERELGAGQGITIRGNILGPIRGHPLLPRR